MAWDIPTCLAVRWDIPRLGAGSLGVIVTMVGGRVVFKAGASRDQ
ncbi:MAG: hypothetical protein WA667_04135 [Candidatus Nitrosopolaris sp.]